MKKSISIHLIHVNENALNAAQSALRGRDHSSVYSIGYDIFRGNTVEGYFTLNATIHFYDGTERDNAKGELKAVNGIIHSCEVGSKIITLLCYHDELGENGSPIRADEIETIEEVV